MSIFNIHDIKKHLIQELPSEAVGKIKKAFLGKDSPASAYMSKAGINLDGLLSQGFNALDSRGINIPGNNGIGVSGVPGWERPYTLDEMERRIGPAHNLAENFNPLGLSFNFADLIEDFFDDDDDVDIDTEQFDVVRNRVYLINYFLFSQIDVLYKGFQNVIDILQEDSVDVVFYKQKIIQYFEAGASYYDNDNLWSDIFDLARCAEEAKVILLPYATDDEVQLTIEVLDSLIARCETFTRQFEAVAPYIKERAFNISPTSAPTPTGILNVDKGFLDNARADLISRTSFSGSSRRIYRSSFNNNSSYPKLATDFGNIGENDRDRNERIDEEVATSLPQATPYDGSGDKAQDEPSVDTLPANDAKTGPVGQLDNSRWPQYLQELGNRESGNDYTAVNTIGYCGRWQFGAMALIDEGYVKPGTNVRNLKSDSVWTGKNGVNKRDDWLANKNDCQDTAMFNYTRRNYKSISRMKIIDKKEAPNEVAGYLAVAHLLGPGGARNFKNGNDGADQYGTKASDYYNALRGAVSGGVPSGEASTVAASLGATEGEQTQAYVDSTTVPDAPSVTMPSSDSAATEYPHNRVKTYEGGHFKEYDSTPGSERIQERHKSGSGYEITADGQFKQTVVTDSYRAVMGDDFLIVHGHCNITVAGDIGIAATANININAGDDLNIVAGGDVNMRVGGNNVTQISGSDMHSVEGDSSVNIGGFQRIGVDGDTQYEAASVNVAARDGNFNVAASENVYLDAVQSASVTGKASAAINTTGNFLISVGASYGVAAANVAFGSDGIFDVNASSVSYESGSMSFKSGSVIQVSPEVSHATWSSKSAVAATLGSAPKPADGTDSATYPHTTDHNEKQEHTSSDIYDKDVQEYSPIESDRSQRYAAQTEGSGEGYRNPVSAKAVA